MCRIEGDAVELSGAAERGTVGKIQRQRHARDEVIGFAARHHRGGNELEILFLGLKIAGLKIETAASARAAPRPRGF